ncbi:MAG: hypothetical protein OXH28_00965 [bacterium]|nr:hypothetical protein [bacterium]
MAQHAAELHQVRHCVRIAGCGAPTDSCRRSVITEGLDRVIICAVERFACTGGEHVKTLPRQGKTLALVALHHLTGAKRVAHLAGRKDLLNDRQLRVPGARASRAALLGPPLAPGHTSCNPDGTVVRAISGETA